MAANFTLCVLSMEQLNKDNDDDNNEGSVKEGVINFNSIEWMLLSSLRDLTTEIQELIDTSKLNDYFCPYLPTFISFIIEFDLCSRKNAKSFEACVKFVWRNTMHPPDCC